jgi:hypothetical protein
MDIEPAVADLKRKLLKEVRSLFHRNGSVWKEPILDVVQDLRKAKVPAVLFGGTLRSLLVSRISQGRLGRPRDIDIVVSGTTLSQLEERFRHILARRTRFGGLRLQHGAWQFDVWPIGETWAFKHDRRCGPAEFAELPKTTTFNLEAVAVEAWSYGGKRRALFSGDDQFFEGILAKTIELNREDNPFPELTVVRGVILASELGFDIGPRLARYIGDIGASMEEDVVEGIQVSHYGHARMNSRTLHDFIATIVRLTRDGQSGQLPLTEELRSWVDGGLHPYRQAV